MQKRVHSSGRARRTVTFKLFSVASSESEGAITEHLAIMLGEGTINTHCHPHREGRGQGRLKLRPHSRLCTWKQTVVKDILVKSKCPVGQEMTLVH